MPVGVLTVGVLTAGSVGAFTLTAGPVTVGTPTLTAGVCTVGEGALTDGAPPRRMAVICTPPAAPVIRLPSGDICITAPRLLV